MPVLTLVIGGAASGKSAYAEALVQALPGRRVYLATMRPSDAECAARIEKHRRQRAGKGFETVERYVDLAHCALPGEANVLLECMSNLLANELYGPEGGGTEAVLTGVYTLLSRCWHLTVVTNEVFSGGSAYDASTLHYLRELARINRALAARADRVIEVACGLPQIWKGSL